MGWMARACIYAYACSHARACRIHTRSPPAPSPPSGTTPSTLPPGNYSLPCRPPPPRYYTINVPLKDGTSDDTFHALFKPIMRKCMDVFQPGAVVMQCGVCMCVCVCSSQAL